MSKRDEIKADIDKIADDRLEQLHLLIQEFEKERSLPKKKGLLRSLQEIRIEGPVDFSENWNLYVSGGKSVDENLP